MGNDLHARVQTLARPRRRRIGVSDRWDSSGGAARDDYLICYPAPAALLIPANSSSLCARAVADTDWSVSLLRDKRHYAKQT
jgi:hypothetical protein